MRASRWSLALLAGLPTAALLAQPAVADAGPPRVSYAAGFNW